ncbi:DNA polymerase III subunit beta [bacterium]|nr:DNA polymerase III subunit beta [bacterium]
MELKIGRNGFLSEVQKIQNITPIKGTKPILSCFLLETSGDGVYLSATDLNVGIKVYVQAEVSIHGKVCLPAKVVYDILRELPENSSVDLLLEENNRLRFTCMNSLFHVPSVDTEEFPAFPVFETQIMHQIPLAILTDMFYKVNIAVPVVEQKLYGAPAGALFSGDSKGIEMVGTDGLRMAYVCSDKLNLPVNVTKVLPKKLLDELPKILPNIDKGKEKASDAPDKKGMIMVGLTENHIIFSWQNIIVFALLLENKFPDYKQPISVKNDKVVILDRERFRQSVRRVSLLSEKKDWFIHFRLSPGKFVLDSEDVDIGDALDKIEVDYNGEGIDIGFNPRYILDALSVIDDPEVSLEMSDNESLAILRPKDQENVKFIIMPVRL